MNKQQAEWTALVIDSFISWHMGIKSLDNVDDITKLRYRKAKEYPITEASYIGLIQNLLDALRGNDKISRSAPTPDRSRQSIT